MFWETARRLSTNFSEESLQARRKWPNIFTVVKGGHLQPRTVYLARLSFRFDEEIKFYRQEKRKKSSVPSNQFYKKC